MAIKPVQPIGRTEPHKTILILCNCVYMVNKQINFEAYRHYLKGFTSIVNPFNLFRPGIIASSLVAFSAGLLAA